MRQVSTGHYVVGREGLVPLRSWLCGDGALADRRVREIAWFTATPGQPPLHSALGMTAFFVAADGSAGHGAARAHVARSVDPAMVHPYVLIGREMVEVEEQGKKRAARSVR